MIVDFQSQCAHISDNEMFNADLSAPGIGRVFTFSGGSRQLYSV